MDIPEVSTGPNECTGRVARFSDTLTDFRETARAFVNPLPFVEARTGNDRDVESDDGTACEVGVLRMCVLVYFLSSDSVAEGREQTMPLWRAMRSRRSDGQH